MTGPREYYDKGVSMYPASFEFKGYNKIDVENVKDTVLFHSEWNIDLRPHYSKCPEYLAHNHLQTNSAFHKDDCLYFKISHHDHGL